jgi:bifunctional non-homologous end joining protein LigD
MRELQLATLVDEPPEGDDWFHEQKFDGYRILAERDGDRVELWSRNGNPWTQQFQTIAAALGTLHTKQLVLDGEVAAVMPDGRTSFGALHDGAPLVYFVFDVLAADGVELAHMPLSARKAKLEALLDGAPPEIKYSSHVVGKGPEFFALACKRGLEGIISKQRDQPYTPGRGRGWLKTKCLQRQEMVIGGFTEPDGARRGLGALLVGVYDGAKLHYAGKVGTGFSSKLLVELRGELDGLAQVASPFEPEPAKKLTGPRVHWVAPELVCEVAFLEWTSDGRLRHPSFQGMRRDKPARSVVREKPEHVN